MWGAMKRALRLEGAELCGVGIVFTEIDDGSLVVTALLPNCPADACEKIAIGDTLYEVDGVNYYRADKSRVATAVLGPANSIVRLGLKRGLRYESDPVYYVTLERGKVPNVGQVAKMRVIPPAS
jgi:C-terminal processing protease CtpA/Prc